VRSQKKLYLNELRYILTGHPVYELLVNLYYFLFWDDHGLLIHNFWLFLKLHFFIVSGLQSKLLVNPRIRAI
jgi:hypothetical protein